jgi:hypothetical protein
MSNSSFVPKYFLIQSISKGLHTTITFTEDHDYKLGEYVSFRCSQDNGMFQINEKRGRVLALTSDTITVDIDSTNYSDFNYTLEVQILPVAVPAGSGVSVGEYNPFVILDDCFDNIRTS